MSKTAFPLDSLGSYFSALKEQLETSSDDYEYYYRGCSVHDWDYNVVPGIYRPDNDGGSRIPKEHINFREMILRSPNDFLNEKTTLEKLVKMQHYLLPTRLLDITSNPLVALYFACQTFNDKKVNGKVYVFKIKKEEIKYYDSDAVSLVSNLAKVDVNKTKGFSKGFGHLIHEIREEKPHFLDNIADELDIESVFPVKVKLNNNRIVRQSGAFLIFGMEDLTSKEKPAIFPNWIIEDELLIDELAKNSILKALDSLAINKNTLFPELDYQANYLAIK